MNTLGTGKLYVKDLFSKSRFYRIPEYQRAYVWGTDQINDFLNDITSAMDADPGKEYFIGCMIWNKVAEESNGYRFENLDILDGQQRFITLFLLHAVLRDLSSDPKLAAKVDERLKQEEDPFDNIPERNRIEFVVRQDKAFLDECVLEAGGTREIVELRHTEGDERQPVSVRRMAGAIVDMHKWWDQRLDEIDEAKCEEYLADFFGYLSNNVLALFLSTPDNLDDAYNLFTVLNSRGLQLRAADILRAQNLRHIDDDKQRHDWARAWDGYVDAVRDPLNSFDELLMYAALSKIKFTSDKTKTLNHAFEYLVERGDITRGDGFFKLVDRHVRHFKAISTTNLQIPTAHETDFRNLYFILSATVGGQFVMPLLHYRSVFGDNSILDFLVRLDNLVTMAWLLGRRTVKLRMFVLMRRMDEIAAEGGDPAELALRFLGDEVMNYEYQHLRSKTDVTIEEFRELLDTEFWGAFGGTKLNKTRYLLLKLDLLHGSSQTRLDFNRASSSVEHIMPRKPSEAYPRIDLDEHSEWVHRLGNLVLLDQKKNSSLSNASYKTKWDRYQKAFEARPYTQSVFMRHRDWELSHLMRQHEYAVGRLIEYYRTNSLEGLWAARSTPDPVPMLL